MKIDFQEINNNTYNTSAKQLAEYFTGIGAKIEDIERALELAEKPTNAHVIEIGCGNGRDAVEITRRVADYQGFDPSEGLLDLARQKLPGNNFIHATATSYPYPQGTLHVVYAFASLLHVPREDLGFVFEKVCAALRPGGIFYISTKERAQYKEQVKKDAFGERIFYKYSTAILMEIAGEHFENVYEDHQLLESTQWLTLALKKKV